MHLLQANILLTFSGNLLCFHCTNITDEFACNTVTECHLGGMVALTLSLRQEWDQTIVTEFQTVKRTKYMGYYNNVNEVSAVNANTLLCKCSSEFAHSVAACFLNISA